MNISKKNCPKDLKDQFEALLERKEVGLIINERVINVPQETAQPLVNLLFDEINARQRTSQQRNSENLSSSRSTSCSRTFLEKTLNQLAWVEASARGMLRQRWSARPEDQCFHKVSKMSFQWKSRELGENDDVDSFQPMRLCMVVDANSVPRSASQGDVHG